MALASPTRSMLSPPGLRSGPAIVQCTRYPNTAGGCGKKPDESDLMLMASASEASGDSGRFRTPREKNSRGRVALKTGQMGFDADGISIGGVQPRLDGCGRRS